MMDMWHYTLCNGMLFINKNKNWYMKQHGKICLVWVIWPFDKGTYKHKSVAKDWAGQMSWL